MKEEKKLEHQMQPKIVDKLEKQCPETAKIKEVKINQDSSNNDIQELISKLEKLNLVGVKKEFGRMKLYRQYRKEVVIHLQTKLNSELINFANIDFMMYAKIEDMWMRSDYEKIQSIKADLDYHSFRSLGQKHWLNDSVIHEYAKLLDKRVNELGKRIKVADSYFHTVLKKDKEKIKAILEKKNLQETKSFLIVVHDENHWFFTSLKFGQIWIYDSIRQSEEYYNKLEAIVLIKRFADWFNQTEHKLIIDDSYPIQTNASDCGVFTLCGMKDWLKDVAWSFREDDMTYKRMEIAKQLFQGEIYGL